jgi:predicted transcriptional regulator
MDVLYRRGSATALEVHRALEDPPTPTTVRGLLRILEEKGHVGHEVDGTRYVYRPSVSRDAAAAQVLPHVIRTFFGGSHSRALAALLGADGDRLDKAEIDRLSEIVEQARKSKS